MKIRVLGLLTCILLGMIPNHSIAASISGQVSKNGWYDSNGASYYYQSNQLAKGWLLLNGKWYYFNQTDGTMLKGWIFYQNKWYFLGSDGTMQTGWILDNHTWYFLDHDGAMKTGWLLYGGQQYFLNNNGGMQTGWLYLGGKWYYFTKDGSMQKGWILDGGNWYYLSNNGIMQTGWLNYNNQKYFLKPNGAMQVGWINLGGWNYFNKSGAWVPNTVADQLTSVSQNKQLILVTANGYNTDVANISTFEKIDDKWYQKLNTTGFLGKYGFAVQMKEGAEKSPRGKYTIGTAFGRFSNPGTKLPYRQITTDDVWVDDPSSALYNTWQEASQNNNRWQSAEKMNISAYNYGFVINYNTFKPVPGAGSAIFFHVSNSYTLGCTGTAESNVLSILRWVDPSKEPVIIQTPASELKNY